MELKEPGGFIFPGDTESGAYLSFSRAIARRAERRVFELLDLGIIENAQLLIFLNRLSSFIICIGSKGNSKKKVTLIIQWLRITSMIGTLVNFGAIIVGGFIRIIVGIKNLRKDKNHNNFWIRHFTFLYAASLFLKNTEFTCCTWQIIDWGLIGEWIHIQEGVEKLAMWLESKFSRRVILIDRNKFIHGFLTSTLFFASVQWRYLEHFRME